MFAFFISLGIVIGLIIYFYESKRKKNEAIRIEQEQIKRRLEEQKIQCEKQAQWESERVNPASKEKKHKDAAVDTPVNVTLCNEKTDRVNVYVSASILESSLIISGQDYGKAVTETWDVGTYKYYYSFDQDNFNLLKSLLVTDDIQLKDALQERFGGMDGCKKLREFCQANDIQFLFSNNISDKT